MDNYAAWQLNPEDFPAGATLREQIGFLARFGILAPSVHNTQPWQLAIIDDGLIVKPNYARQLGVADRTGRGLWLSLGSFAENIALAAKAFGLDTTAMLDEKAPQIEIRLQKGAGKVDFALARAIINRRSNRHRFEAKPVPGKVLQAIEAAWPPGEIAVQATNDSAAIELVANLTERGITMALSLDDFKNELAHLIKPAWSRQPDGMPGPVLELDMIGSVTTPLKFRLTDVAESEGRLEKSRLLASGGLILVSSRGDTLKYWFEAGRAYQRTAVVATKLGLASSTMAAAVEAPEFHKDIEAYLKTPLRLQTITRIGYCKQPTPHSPRFKLEQVLE